MTSHTPALPLPTPVLQAGPIRLLAVVLAGIAFLVWGPAHAQAASMAVSPRHATPGTVLEIRGAGFAPGQATQVLMGRPNTRAFVIATVRANRQGRVQVRQRIHGSIDTGRWIVMICQRSCRTRARYAVNVQPRITFRPEVGVMSARIGMTRAQLVRQLGPARGTRTRMQWQANGSRVMAHMRNGRVHTFQVAGPRSCAPFGACIGQPAQRFINHYGDRLVRYESSAHIGWLHLRTVGGARRFTALQARNYEPATRIQQAWIGTCAQSTALTC